MSDTPQTTPPLEIRRIHNFTPTTYATGQLAGQKRRRNRQAVSCDPCRVRKIKCDRGQPCGPCSVHSRQSACTYGGSSNGSPDGGESKRSHTADVSVEATIAGPANAPTMTQSHRRQNLGDERISRLERQLEGLQETVYTLVEELQATGRRTEPSSYGLDLSSGSCPFSSNDTGNIGADPGNYRLTEVRNGMLGSKKGILHYIGPTGWTIHHHEDRDIITLFQHIQEFEAQWNDYVKLRDRFKGWTISSLFDCVCAVPSSLITSVDLLSMLPERKVGEVLVKRFLVTFNKTHPIVDEPTLLDEVTQFYDSGMQAPKSGAWLALFAAVLAAGFLLPVYPIPEGSFVKYGRYQGSKLLPMALRYLMSSPTIFRRPDTRVFQVMILSILGKKLELHEPDGSDAISGLLGITRQMAFAMGLHRDPSVASNNYHQVSPLEAELRRKLWTTFQLIDLEHSLQSGMPYLLKVSDYQTRIYPGPIANEENFYLQCIANCLPVWAQVLQATNSCIANPLPNGIFNLQARLHELGDQIDRRLPARNLAQGLSSEVAFVHELRRSLLFSINSRMITILNTALAPAGLAGHARNLSMEAAMQVLEHSNLLADLAPSLPPGDSQDSWAHLVVALLFCQISYASVHLLLRIRRTIVFRDPPLPEVVVTRTKRRNITASSLVEFIEQSGRLFDQVVHHSPSAVKGSMFYHGFRADIRERIRLSETPEKSRDPSIIEVRFLLDVMRQAMDESLLQSKQAIDRAASSLDPPPLLCPEADPNSEEAGQVRQPKFETEVSGGQANNDLSSSGIRGLGLQNDASFNMDMTTVDQNGTIGADWDMTTLWPFDMDWWLGGPEFSGMV